MITWLAHVGSICHEQATHEQRWSKKKKLGGVKGGAFPCRGRDPCQPPLPLPLRMRLIYVGEHGC